jgi:hypothetical protein
MTVYAPRRGQLRQGAAGDHAERTLWEAHRALPTQILVEDVF